MIALVVHGGAWDIPDEMVKSHREGCRKALLEGWKILEHGGSAVDAVEATIKVFEDDPTFDAGRGSFMNALGEIELDASIMNGTTFRAGAVAAVQNIRHPITLARKVMEESEHVLLVGLGAIRFAKEVGVEQCSLDELLVDRELQRWKDLQGRETFSTKEAFQKKHPMGTVGCVALDSKGTIVVGTSTGGTPNKYPGRVGDSPLIGCGTYADSTIGGVSATGWGEAIIKVVLAKTVINLMEWHDGNPQKAAEEGIRILEKKAQGNGGVIVLNRGGKIGCAHNTPRMARGLMTSTMKEPEVKV